jgi:hypothetical protein
VPHGFVYYGLKLLGSRRVGGRAPIDICEKLLQTVSRSDLVGGRRFFSRAHHYPVQHLVTTKRLADQRFERPALLLDSFVTMPEL